MPVIMLVIVLVFMSMIVLVVMFGGFGFGFRAFAASFRHAVLATPEKRHIVRLKFKSLGREFFKMAAAAREFEHLVAGVAMKVVVMGLARDFVSRALARDIHGLNLVGLNQQFERPIDGRKT